MRKSLLCLLAVVSAACNDITDREYPAPEPAPFTSTDADATAQTRNLLKNLRALAAEGKTLFGHQSSTLYGIGWTGDANRSDIKSVCGSFPAVIGYDLSGIELGNDENIDGDSFNNIRNAIIAAYQRGGITTLSWHANNPVSGGDSWDTTPAVGDIIPGGVLHEKFRGWLDKTADFIKTLRTADGTQIPILFRPWHEHTGSGFWWGKGNCTAQDYITLWQFTVEYLRDTKEIHNMLYVYSPDIVNSYDNYLEFWPGDEYVDIIGLDAYERTGWSLPSEGARLLRLVKHIAYQKNKPAAFTETGLENNKSNPTWWTGNLAAAMNDIPLAYVLVWRNAAENHFFGPYPGCVSEDDFRAFAQNGRMLFEDDIQNIYK